MLGPIATTLLGRLWCQLINLTPWVLPGETAPRDQVLIRLECPGLSKSLSSMIPQAKRPGTMWIFACQWFLPWEYIFPYFLQGRIWHVVIWMKGPCINWDSCLAGGKNTWPPGHSSNGSPQTLSKVGKAWWDSLLRPSNHSFFQPPDIHARWSVQSNKNNLSLERNYPDFYTPPLINHFNREERRIYSKHFT